MGFTMPGTPGTNGTFDTALPGAINQIDASEYQTLAAAGNINSYARKVVFTGTTYTATLAAIGTTQATETPVGARIWLENRASGSVTVNHSGAGAVVTLAAGKSCMILAVTSATTWNVEITAAANDILDGISSAGDVTKVGTPANNQVGVWTGDGTLEGDAALTFDTATDVWLLA